MKWMHKGHEFDELGVIFQKNSTLLLIGTEEENAELKKKLEFLDVSIETISFCVGNRKTLIGKMLLLITSYIMVAAIKRKIEKICTGRIIIINYPRIISKRLVLYFEKAGGGYIKNTTLFSVADFMDRYIPIFAVYVKNKLYSKHNSFIVTTICNLNCKYCLNFNPYLKNKRHNDILLLKQDIDIYFSIVDKVGWFHLSGGEPLLYPNFGELIQYIFTNYGNKIDELSFSTNGTIAPSDELCRIFQKCHVKVLIDDYTKAVPKTKKTMYNLIKKLKEYTVSFYIDSKKYFWIQFPPAKDFTSLSEKDLVKKYDACQWLYHGQPLINGKLCNCLYASYAETAELITVSSDDYFDLTVFSNTEQERKELMEFRLGYSIQGYSSLCRYCNGSGNINTFKSPAGEQAHGRLYWDSNNPVQLEHK